MVYRDIARGYSELNFNNELLYLKHVSNLDFGTLQEFEDEKYEEAKGRGLFTRKQKVESLIEQELWSDSKERKIEKLKLELENLNTTIQRLVLAKQKKEIRKRIDQVEKELNSLQLEKDALVGVTCEQYSQSKTNQEFLRFSVFKDQKLEYLKYENEDFYELSNEAMSEISTLYNEILIGFSEVNIKKIAASGFFLNGVIASQSNAAFFFGKPIIGLSNYQTDLFSTAIRYKSVLENGKPPPDNYYSDIRMVVDWFELELGGKAISGIKGHGQQNLDGQMVMGASKQEMASISDTTTNMSKEGKVVNFAKEAANKISKKTGEAGKAQKHLSFKDMMEIHGEV